MNWSNAVKNSEPRLLENDVTDKIMQNIIKLLLLKVMLTTIDFWTTLWNVLLFIWGCICVILKSGKHPKTACFSR